MSYLTRGSLLGLFFMVLLLPIIPVTLLWNFIGPSSVWESIALIIISFFVYIAVFIIEIFVLFILCD